MKNESVSDTEALVAGVTQINKLVVCIPHSSSLADFQAVARNLTLAPLPFKISIFVLSAYCWARTGLD